MLRFTPQLLKSRVNGGYLRHIKATCKGGRGKVHTRSTTGKRGRHKPFGRTHGIRDGTPSTYNLTRGGLGVKFGFGGLFGARRLTHAQSAGSQEAIDEQIYGHPSITNTYCGHLDRHPALEAVVSGAPINLTLVMAMPKFTFNPDATGLPKQRRTVAEASSEGGADDDATAVGSSLPTSTTSSSSSSHSSSNSDTAANSAIIPHVKSLPRTWRAALPPMTELLQDKLMRQQRRMGGADAMMTAGINGLLVLTTTRASVAIKTTALADLAVISRSNFNSNTRRKQQHESSIDGSDDYNQRSPPATATTIVPSGARDALIVAMRLLLDAHTASFKRQHHIDDANDDDAEGNANGSSSSADSSVTVVRRDGAGNKVIVGDGGVATAKKRKSVVNDTATTAALLKKVGITTASGASRLAKLGGVPSALADRKRPSMFAPSVAAKVPPALNTTGLPTTSLSATSTTTAVTRSSSSASTTTDTTLIGSGVMTILAAVRDGVDIVSGTKKLSRDGTLLGAGGLSSTAARKTNVIVGTCLRVEPEWRRVVMTSAQQPPTAAAVGSASSTSTNAEANGSTAASRETMKAAFLTAADRYGLRSSTVNKMNGKKKRTNKNGANTMASSDGNTSVGNSALIEAIHANDGFSTVRSATMTATSVRSAGDRRTGFVTMTSALPVATVCQWALFNNDKSRAMESQQVIFDDFEAKQQWRRKEHLDGDDNDDAVAANAHQTELDTLREFGGDRRGVSAASAGQTWQTPKTRPLHPFADAVKTSRTAPSRREGLRMVRELRRSSNGLGAAVTADNSGVGGGAGAGATLSAAGVANAALPPMNVTMLVRCFEPKRVRLGMAEEEEVQKGAEHHNIQQMDENSTFRLGEASSSSSAPLVAPARLNAALAKSEWQMTEMLTSVAASRANGVAGAPLPSSAPAEEERSFGLGDVLVGSSAIESLVLPSSSRRKEKMATASADANGIVTAPSTNSRAARQNRRRRSGSNSGARTPSASPLDASSAASPAVCPLVSYINDEVHNPTTAFLKKRLGVRPIVEDVFGAVDSLKVWHASVSRGNGLGARMEQQRKVDAEYERQVRIMQQHAAALTE